MATKRKDAMRRLRDQPDDNAACGMRLDLDETGRALGRAVVMERLA